jgi:SAM-dependent methyltransferase
MIQIKNCPICHSNKLKILKRHTFKYPGNNVKNNLNDISYIRRWILFQKIIPDEISFNFSSTLCCSCGFIFTNPRFNENEIKIKYETINELGSVKFRIKNTPPANAKKRAKRIFTLIQRFHNFDRKKKPKILDYGGAAGDNLYFFMSNFQCNILDYERWNLPKKINYLGRNLSDLKEIEKFDVILLLHTLEHIVDPKEFLIQIASFLKKDGIIYVEVPLGCFQEWKFLREPLTHINFFSEESLYNCFKFTNLDIDYLHTSFQQVTTTKKWCVNIIASKRTNKNKINFSNFLSTKKQMSYLFYYIPYIFEFRTLVRNLFKVYKKNLH